MRMQSIRVRKAGGFVESKHGFREMPETLRGRQDQWLTTIRALDKHRDRLSILLVEGVLGSGKTRFLQEVTKAAAARGFTFVPYPDGTRPVSAKWWRDESAFSAGIHKLLEPGALRKPVMLAADDIHAAHFELVRELCCVIRYREESPVMLALSRRDGVSQVPEFEKYLASGPDVARVRLKPLSMAQAMEVATDLLTVPPDESLTAILAGAAGNPFLLTELIHGLRDEGQLVYVGGTSVLLSPILPQRIERLVAGMVGEFSVTAQKVLRLAATMGTRWDVSELAELAGEPISSLLPVLDELLTAGILTPSGTTMAFQYPLVRKALLAGMPAPVVTALQRQANDRSADGAKSARQAREHERVSRFSALTDSERAIAELAAEGLTNLQIARRVNRSSHTVNFHLRQVFRKLGIRSRVELARIR